MRGLMAAAVTGLLVACVGDDGNTAREVDAETCERLARIAVSSIDACDGQDSTHDIGHPVPLTPSERCARWWASEAEFFECDEIGGLADMNCLEYCDNCGDCW